MYIFLMDKGQLEQLVPTPPSVPRLQAELKEKFGLHIEHQILLVSGGFQLGSEDRLPINGAGLNKSNPIYVFTRASDSDDEASKQPDILTVNDGGYPSKLEELINAPPSYTNLTKGCSRVDDIVPIAKQTSHAIRQLMLQQDQMIQGWHAALANLAEFAAATEKRWDAARKEIAPFENCHIEWQKKFQQVADLKRDLSQVPLLPQLVHQLCGFSSERSKVDASDHPPIPSNLYEWVCLQCTLLYDRAPLSVRKGSLSATAASRLRIAAMTLGRPDLLPECGSGRSRTTSAEQLGQTAPNYAPGDVHRRSTVGQGVPSSLASGTMSALKNLFYVGGSQPSLNSLVNCGTEGSSSPSVSSVVSGAACTETDQSTGCNPYEVDFLSIIHKSQLQLNFLRYGSRTVPDRVSQSDGEITYAQRQLIRVEQLLSLVSSCSIYSRGSPTGSDSLSDTSDTPKECETDNNRTGSGLPTNGHPFQYVRPELVRETREALCLSYFSQHLTHVSKLTDVAGQMNDRISQVHNTLKLLHRQQDLTGYVTQFQTVLDAFRKLCHLLDDSMDRKLKLAETLRHRQRWLQKFQSELQSLDTGIQSCLNQTRRVMTMATLITQLQKAPEIYVRCLVEVARQHDFDQAFVQISREHKVIRSSETQRRRTFAKQIKENVLHSLFTPWIGTKYDPCGPTRLPSFARRTINSPDFETISDESTGSHVFPVPSNSQKSSRAQEITRSTMNSRSEPQLNKLFKTTGLPTRLLSKDAGLLPTSPVLHEVHEDDTDPCDTGLSSHSKTPSRSSFTVDPSVRVRYQPSPLSAKEESSRRASVPMDIESAYPTPKWTIEDTDASSEAPTDTHSGVADPSHSPCITVEDLVKLSHLLPTRLADYLREELVKLSVQRTVPVPSGLCQAFKQPAQHVGLCPQQPSPSEDRNPTQTRAESTVVGMDVECQVGFSLLPSLIAQWPLRSHSASLFLPVGDSPPRQEPIRSSLCSWDLCHILPNRSLKRSVSMSAIARFHSVTTRATQTEEEEGNVRQASISSAPRSDALSLASSAVSDAVVQSPKTIPTALHEADSWPGENSSENAADRDCEHVNSSGGLASALLHSDNIIELPTAADAPSTEHSNGADAEFATPSTVMSSSFHSTRTNLSIRSDVVANAFKVASTDELHRSRDGLDELGTTPTITKNQWLNHGRASTECRSADCSESRQFHSCSRDSSPQDPNCSCHLGSLHAHCVQLLEEFADTLFTKQSQPDSSDHADGVDRTDDGDSAMNKTRMQRLAQLMKLLYSYTEDFPLCMCPIHPNRTYSGGGSQLLSALNQQLLDQLDPTRRDEPNQSQLATHEGDHGAYCIDEVAQTDSNTTEQQCAVGVQAEIIEHTGFDASITQPSGSVTDEIQSSYGRRSHADRNMTEICTVGVQTEVTECTSLGTSVTPPSTPSADETRTATDNVNTEQQMTTLCVEASTSGPGLSQLPVLSQLSYNQSNALRQSSIRISDRYFTFVHSNFTMNDIVVFIPVPGITPQTHSTRNRADGTARATPAFASSGDTAEKQDEQQQSSLCFSMLSSTIIQSMDSCTAVQPSLRKSNGADRGSGRRGRDAMNTSLHQTVALASDLLGIGTDLPVTSGGTRRSRTSGGISSSNHPPVTQWRMLSSDGQVYFLHQDDFASLNLDLNTDYCQPIHSSATSTLSGSRRRHPSRHLCNSITNLPCSDALGEGMATPGELGSTSDKTDPIPDPELRSYFILASYQRKERCLSKRADNRFNLPKDFTFYRVRAKPIHMCADDTAPKSSH